MAQPHQTQSPIPLGDAASRTRDELIDAGERLYALKGIEGTNLLAIAREAGQANKSAVQYHFGDRKELIRAILDARVAWLEARRAERLAALGPDPDLRVLFEVVLLPIADLVDAKGRHTYARFLLQFMVQFEPWEGVQHPLRRPHQKTALDQLRRQIHRHTPHLTTERLLMRWEWCLRNFLGLLIDHDNALARGRPGPALDLVIRDALDITVAALTLPDRGSVDEARGRGELRTKNP